MAEMKRMASKKPVVALAVSSSAVQTPQGNNEVQNLKKRIEEMNRNIESLTAMVEKVSLKQEQEDNMEAGNKRKKIDNGQLSSLDEVSLDVFPEPPGVSSSLVDRDNDMTDDAFLDQLFMSFQDEGASSAAIPDETLSDEVTSSRPENGNRPDPVLMKKLGDALELLPKVIQEMIIHRLIHAITEGLDEPMPTLAALLHEGKKLQKAIPVIPVHA
jgi:TolA-binding protein